MSSAIGGVNGLSPTAVQLPLPAQNRQQAFLGPVKENQSNNINSSLPLQQLQQRRIGTGQKIIESSKHNGLPSSSSDRRQRQPLRGPAGYTDIVDVLPERQGLQHQRSGIPRPTKFLGNDPNPLANAQFSSNKPLHSAAPTLAAGPSKQRNKYLDHVTSNSKPSPLTFRTQTCWRLVACPQPHLASH